MDRGFYGWRIVAVAFFAQAITIGLTLIPFSLFITPLVAEFGLPIARVQVGMGLFTLVMMSAGAGVGVLLDRFSIRWIMAGGALLVTLSFLLMSLADHPWQLAILFGIGAATGVAMTGPLAASTVVARWFEAKRGLAMGLASMGPPAGGLLLTPVAGWLLAEMGWRNVLQVFACATFALAPVCLLVVRNSPEEVGQAMDGRAPGDVGPGDVQGSEEWSAASILRSRNFWGLALAMGIVFGLGGGWNANAARFGEDLGYSGQEISALIGISAGLGIPSTLLFGRLADRFSQRALLWCCMGGNVVALLILWTLPAPPLFAMALFILGFAGAGLLPVYATFIGRLFGAASFGRVMGLGGILMLPFGGLAPILVGGMRDQSGSYQGALLLLAIATAGGASFLAWIKAPKPSPHDTG
ncbi:MAG: MFS transporter [Myxococcota bacterium]|nr:MFS transporter [Myxococcota bacterium]